MKAPDNCPTCNSNEHWKLVEIAEKSFDGKKAAVSFAFFGVIGLAAGHSEKKMALYKCEECGFSNEYDAVADKEDSLTHDIMLGKYVNKSSNIDVVNKATPQCPFCNKPQNLYVRQDGSYCRFVCKHCHAEYRCKFSLGNKVKRGTTEIMDCGEENINNFESGACDASLLIHDETKIK